MAGVKGRSGRRSKKDEEKRLAIIDKAWELISEKLNSKDPGRYAIAKDIVVKDITTKLEGRGFGDAKIIVIHSKKTEKGEHGTTRICGELSAQLPAEP